MDAVAGYSAVLQRLTGLQKAHPPITELHRADVLSDSAPPHLTKSAVPYLQGKNFSSQL